MSVFGSYYPAGAEHDPSAPWNQEDADGCDTCDGTGMVECHECDGERDDCDRCGGRGPEQCSDCYGTGEGETPSQRRARLAEEKADADYDREKDERE